MLRLLLLRSLPVFVACVALTTTLLQWRYPLSYPWPWLLFLFCYLVALVCLAWRHLSWKEGWQQLVPPVVTLAAAMFGGLMATTWPTKIMLSVTATGLTFFSLELLFLSVYTPTRYPVNGLSRLNLALLPLAVFMAVATANGLVVFIQFSRGLLVTGLVAMVMLLFYFTAHPTADRSHRLRWGFLGAVIGLHIGLLSFLLPVSMAVHGALAGLLATLPLRFRRYAYKPSPTKRVAWMEGSLGLACFLAIIMIARWT